MKPKIHAPVKDLIGLDTYPLDTVCGRTLYGPDGDGTEEEENCYLNPVDLERHSQMANDDPDGYWMTNYDVCQDCLDSPKWPLIVLAATDLE